MPPRRRLAPISAAALPASRRPLGTPPLPATKSSTSARTNSRSPPTKRTDSSSEDQRRTSSSPSSTSHQHDQAAMAPKGSSNVPTTSIAEAKLERQRKRIQEAEAALSAQISPDKRSQAPRGKAKQWKPFDYAADTARATTPGDGGVPVSEVRVNTFRAPSRGSSLARSASVLSHRTSETGPSDMERQDSALTDNGFQLYKGRRNRKNVTELGAYEDKPEERQTTVEATFDKREIYEVFGNALPAPEFIEENVGFRNGQLQFIQHPNGDVSAHQWSTERYIWENIGQFSNIRKKVEGQLGADRLKGETAYQTLQQTTLAYFRIIAKQREASVMGLPFGPKEIQAAIPEPRIEITAAPTGLQAPTAELSTTEQLDARSELPSSRYSNQDARSTSTEQTARLPQATYLPPNVPKGPRADQWDHLNYEPNYSYQNRLQEDPFYSAGSYEHIYGSQPYLPPRYRHPVHTHAPPTRQYPPAAQRPQGLNYDFHFPPSNATGRPLLDPRTQSYTHGRTATPQNTNQLFMQDFATQVPQASKQDYPQLRNQLQNLALGSQADASDAANRRIAATPKVELPRPKPVTPLESRTAIRGQLWKLPETAKERSLSQANIRTVLYDPYQNPSSATKAEPEAEPVKQDASPAFNPNALGNILQPPTSFNPTSSKFFPTGLAPALAKPASPVASVAETNLRDSSPDPYPAKSFQQQTPVIMTSSDSRPTPQTFKGPYFADDPNLRSSIGSATTAISNTSYEEQLHEWWTSGSTFARQEEFFQRLTSTRKDSVSTTSPPAHLTPIGPPSRSNTTTTPKKQEPAFNESITRMLIPVYENLASYVQGPVEKRRDYWSQWSQAPEWAIDRSEHGNDSFFDNDWGTPPARIGRDPRYSGMPRGDDQTLGGSRFGGPGGGYSVPLDRRFAFGGRF